MQARRQSGFTMIELSIVMAMLVVLIALGFAMNDVRQSQADIDRTVADMRQLTNLGEKARLVSGGDNFTRQNTAVVANFLATNDGEIGAYSRTVPMRNPDGNLYLITTTGRVAVVETDVPGLNIIPVGVDGRNVGGNSRLITAFKQPRLMAFSSAAYWDKKNIYCEDHAPADKPAHCP